MTCLRGNLLFARLRNNDGLSCLKMLGRAIALTIPDITSALFKAQ